MTPRKPKGARGEWVVAGARAFIGCVDAPPSTVMLTHLHLHDVGPVPEMRMALQPRLNIVTGDNGLGKSFLLDLAWWALTQTWPWPPHGAVPDRREDSTPRIAWGEVWNDMAPVSG